MSRLAILGGEPAAAVPEGDMFKWPIVNEEMEEAVLGVLRSGAMSGTGITKQFESEFAKWNGVKYALGHCSGTASLCAAFFALGLKRGDEVICPSLTYWASAVPAMGLGVTVSFCDIDPKTLCVDPADLEKRITPATKAVVAVHYCSYPAPMDEIMAVARRHNLKVIEDVSHAQGGFYKGRKLGTIGDVGAMSLMTAKSFAVGEAGMLVTDDREIYERAILWGHYERASELTLPGIAEYKGLPCGGQKCRMHQMSSAVGLVQLKKYDRECAEIDEAMRYFWSLLADLPIDPHIPPDPGSTKAGWYCAKGIYDEEAMEGLSLSYFIDAVRAEGGSRFHAGCNSALHTHPLFWKFDVYGDGKPANYAFRAPGLPGPLMKEEAFPHSFRACNRVFNVPWFRHFRKDYIEAQAAAVRKVYENRRELLSTDPKERVLGALAQSRRNG